MAARVDAARPVFARYRTPPIAQTRTYEARYVLEGEAASAPLGATVTIRFAQAESQSDVSVPIGAVLDDGNRTGVWVIDRGFFDRALRCGPDQTARRRKPRWSPELRSDNRSWRSARIFSRRRHHQE